VERKGEKREREPRGGIEKGRKGKKSGKKKKSGEKEVIDHACTILLSINQCTKFKMSSFTYAFQTRFWHGKFRKNVLLDFDYGS